MTVARAGEHLKVDSFNFRVDPVLKAAFTAASAEEDKPAGQILREFMRAYVEKRHIEAARQQSLLVASLASDPNSDEAEVMRWIENVSDQEGWVG